MESGSTRSYAPLTVALLAVLSGLAYLAFRRLGFGPVGAGLLLAAIALGRRIDLPLYRRKARLGLNVGGGLVPLAIAGQQVAVLPASAAAPLLAATSAVALACFLLARPVAGEGLFLPWALPGLLGAALALLLSPTRAPSVAYVAGTVGPLLGADLPFLRRLGPVRAAIGGAGVFDGLVWSGVLAAWLSVGP